MTALINSESYPYFSAGQILKHSDLNDLIAFLDKQNRLTRGYSIGSGVISPNGLLPSFDESVVPPCININQGVGLSSDGYLFSLLEDKKYTHYKSVKIFKNSLTQLNDEERYKGDFLEHPVYELLTGEADGFSTLPLPQAPPVNAEAPTWEVLKTHVIVLLWYREEIERTPCFNECDEKGSDKLVYFKVLLVNKLDLETDDEQGGNTSDNLVINDAPYIDRLIPAPFENTKLQVRTYPGLRNQYRLLCAAAISRIGLAYRNAAAILQRPNEFSSLENDLQVRLNSFLSIVDNENIGNSNLQYFYDYLKDLILAFEEFADATCDVSNLGNVGELDLNSHPGHLKLGMLSDSSICRDTFIASFLQESKDDPLSLRKVNFLFERMVELTKNTATLFPQGKDALRITPSKGLAFWLSERAIPFYYQTNQVRTKWSFRMNRKQHDHRIPAYDFGSNVAPFRSPLLHDTQAFDFYRIEGVWGKPLHQTILDLEKLRANSNLSFDIQCVKLEQSSEWFQSYLLEEFQDLQLVYSKAKGDLLCILEENPDLFSSSQLEDFLPDSVREFAQTVNQILFLEEYRRTFPQRNRNDDCQLQIFVELLRTYQKRMDAKRFSIFAKEHPGIEHAAGVTKGGTFILAYVDELPANIKELLDSFAAQQNNNLDIQLKTRQALLLELHKAMAEAETEITQTIVADFYLPYQCCDTLLKNSEQLIEPFILLLPRTYCEGDTQRYEITLYPSGGKLTASPTNANGETPYLIEDVANNKYYFAPVQLPVLDAEKATVTFTYQLNNKMATQTVEVRKGLEIEVTRLQGKTPVYDAARNCELVGYLFNYKITNFSDDTKYAYVLDGEVQYFEKDTFQIQIPISRSEVIFFVVATDEINCDARKTIVIKSSELTPFNEDDDGVFIQIEDRPEVVFAGEPDELVIAASVPGGRLIVKGPDDADIHLDVLGACGDGKYQLDTLNLPTGEYEMIYRFPVHNVESNVVNFKIDQRTENPPSPAEANRIGKIIPIYDAAKNCELQALEFSFRIDNFLNDHQYAYSNNGVLTNLDQAEFKIQVPPSLEDFAFEVIVKNKSNLETRTEIKISAPELRVNNLDNISVVIENEPDKIFIGNPDELIFVAEPHGGNLRIENSADGNVLNVPFDAIGDCERPKYKLDTQNMVAGEYRVTYRISPFANEAEKKFVIENLGDDGPSMPRPAAADGGSGNVVQPLSGSESNSGNTTTEKIIPTDDAIINQRFAAHRAKLNVLEEDSKLSKTKTFGLAKSFVLMPPNNVEKLNTNFLEAANSLTKGGKRANAVRKKQYLEIAEIILHNYLDKQVLLQNEQLDEATQDVLIQQLAALKTAKFDLKKAKKDWNSQQLQKAIAAPVIKNILKMLK